MNLKGTSAAGMENASGVGLYRTYSIGSLPCSARKLQICLSNSKILIIQTLWAIGSPSWSAISYLWGPNRQFQWPKLPGRAWFLWVCKTGAITLPRCPCISCWSSLCPRLAQAPQCQHDPKDTCVSSSHGKSTPGTTTLPKPHLCNELITWEHSSILVTSATLRQKSWRRLEHGQAYLPLLMGFFIEYKVL